METTKQTAQCLQYAGYEEHPRISAALQWLRKRHKLSVEVGVEHGGPEPLWGVEVVNFADLRSAIIGGATASYSTYEAAAEAGIRIACKYLRQHGKC